MKDSLIRVGITQGDINGVGYEVVLKVLEDSRILELFTPIVYGSAKIALFYRKQLGLQPIPFNIIRNADDARDGVVNIVNVVGEEVQAVPGEATVEAGRAAYAALQAAVADINDEKIDVIVTAPINKNTIQGEGFHFAGHTEYLAAAFKGEPLMILASDKMRVALVTTHLPVKEVSGKITKESIVEKLQIFNDSLIRDYGIVKPRIAVLALNPHAGDNGLLGTEERDVIVPAIEQAYGEKISCFGPYAADGFFGASMYEKFDGVLAMYHDQGLAPFKALAMDSGVNFTAGLSAIRTSPDHGTGYDIAGKGEASEASMREAIYAAIDIFRNRESHEERTANPLRRQYFDKSKDNVVLDFSKDD